MVAIYNPVAADEWIVIYRGDNWAQTFDVTDEDDTPTDLSAWSDWTAQWRSTPDDETAYDLDVVSGGVDGSLTISAGPDVTRFIGAASGWIDIQAASPEVRTFVKARTHSEKDVTHG